MERIETIGTYDVYVEHVSDILGDFTSIIVMQNGKQIIREDYEGNLPVYTGSHLIASVMLKLDVISIDYIYHNIPCVHRHSEYTNGLLLSGEVVEGETDYFLRIEDTNYFTHHLTYPTKEAV